MLEALVVFLMLATLSLLAFFIWAVLFVFVVALMFELAKEIYRHGFRMVFFGSCSPPEK
ncbi:MAG: hypothetical protein LBQ10_12120 [Desulfovibrio sp.]|nr:hypothetical protein [Desulfovibrio sp.]